MEKNQECTICFVEYSNNSKPHFLPCGHTLCSTCIIKMTQKKVITCPLCQKQFVSDLNKFPINYAIFSSIVTQSQNTGNSSNEFLFENCVRLQKEMHALEKHANFLEEIQEDVLNSNTNIYNDAFTQINTVINSLNNAINQIKQKIDECKRNNDMKIKKRRDEIVSSIEQRKKLMKVLLDAQRANISLDAQSMLELNTLRSVQSSELTIKKAVFSKNISDITKQLIDSLSLSCIVNDENIYVKVENIESNKPEENKKVCEDRNPVSPSVQKNSEENLSNLSKPIAQKPPMQNNYMSKINTNPPQGPSENRQPPDINQRIISGQPSNNNMPKASNNSEYNQNIFEFSTDKYEFIPQTYLDERPQNSISPIPNLDDQNINDYSINSDSEDSKNPEQQANLRNRRYRRGDVDNGRYRNRGGYRELERRPRRGLERRSRRGAERGRNLGNASSDSHDQQINQINDDCSISGSENSKNSEQYANLRNRGYIRRDRGRSRGIGRRPGPRGLNSGNASFDSHEQQIIQISDDCNNSGSEDSKNSEQHANLRNRGFRSRDVDNGRYRYRGGYREIERGSRRRSGRGRNSGNVSSDSHDQQFNQINDDCSISGSEDSKNSEQYANLRSRRFIRRGDRDNGRYIDRGRYRGAGRRPPPRGINSGNTSFDSHEQQINPSDIDWNNIGQVPPQNNPAYRSNEADNLSNNESHQGYKWFIQSGQELQSLPKWIVNQIERKIKNHPLIRIYDRNVLRNIADTIKMIYYQLDNNGNTIPGSEMKLFRINN
ncbi:hypothetical protein SteCoe_31289 [Stentor coeruleus]|uniref:RING-type domain-containing protein n=1 Tax=Stentor coeruleus TaxID=5963 RepID=A0A1R2B1M5_9CILI|nr:hypothetical protein SteCoe_31289 [Stentor coeruleus]